MNVCVWRDVEMRDAEFVRVHERGDRVPLHRRRLPPRAHPHPGVVWDIAQVSTDRENIAIVLLSYSLDHDSELGN